MIRLDGERGTLDVLVDAAELAAREPATADLSGNQTGMGRELFAHMRQGTTAAEAGASMFFG